MTIAERYCGPPDSGNGGYCAGRFAARLAPGRDEAVEVTLRAPVPLETPLSVAVDADGRAATVGPADDPDAGVVATIRLVPWDAPTPPAGAVVDLDAAGRVPGAAPVPGFVAEHPFPGCFVCGPDRAAGDGLRLFAERVTGTATFAVPWTVEAADPALVWAALDCPSSFPMYLVEDPFPGPCVLGRMTARIDRLPEPGATAVVASWREAVDGRKLHTASVLHTADGTRLGAARATWIRIAPTP